VFRENVRAAVAHIRGASELACKPGAVDRESLNDGAPCPELYAIRDSWPPMYFEIPKWNIPGHRPRLAGFTKLSGRTPTGSGRATAGSWKGILSELVRDSDSEDVLLMRHGRPAAVLMSVERQAPH
jgi:hypothetical protein